MRLNGIMAPICTPFAGDGEVDHAALRRNIAEYCARGTGGIRGGRFHGRSAAPQPRRKSSSCLQTVSEAAEGRMLIAGTAAESVRETMRLIARRGGLGYHAALVITPHYYRGQMLRPETQAGVLIARWRMRRRYRC